MQDIVVKQLERVSFNNKAIIDSIAKWEKFNLDDVIAFIYSGRPRANIIKTIIKDGCNGEFVQRKYPNKIEGIVLHDDVLYILTTYRVFALRHVRNCCEAVWLADGADEIENMVGEEIRKIRIDVSPKGTDEQSITWTFVNIQTNRDSYNLRWVVESNGYYSETIQLDDLTNFSKDLHKLNKLVFGEQP